MKNIECNVNMFDTSILRSVKPIPRKVGNQSTMKKQIYMNALSAFDIETSKVKTNSVVRQVRRNGIKTTKTLDKYNSFMWGWQIQIKEYTIKGNYWDEFIGLLKNISQYLKKDEYFVIYVHNLSYEFQFLAGVYDFKPYEVFATDKRKILKCTMFDHFEFRCSYKLTNMGLSKWLKEMGAEHGKTDGLDYDKVIWPWTKTTPEEEEYRTNDVLGLVEALEIQMKRDGDDLYTIPMTSTGYVRRDVKKALRSIPNYHTAKLNPSFEIYQELEKAFRGGVTGANRYYIGEIIENVESFDEKSSYPAQQTTKEFPIGELKQVEDNSLENVLFMMEVRKKAILTGISFKNLRFKDNMWDFPAPYLSSSKCEIPKDCNRTIDNGKVISADYLETYLTDVDLKIIMEIYTWDDCNLFETYACSYGKLPDAYVNTILKYYENKTSLKDVAGEELMYALSKALLNGVYGMGVQRIVKNGIIYENGEFHRDDTPEADRYDKDVKKVFLAYQWGVWITAHARYALYEGIFNVYRQGGIAVYWDTDSCKYFEPEGVTVKWDKVNKKLIKAAKDSNAYATDPNGKVHYIGVFEQERSYRRFITYGAKRYAYEYDEKDGTISTHTTISGVDKRKGGLELEKHGGLEAFTEDFTFVEAGGNTVQYNDIPDVEWIEDPDTGRCVKITRNCSIVPKEYTMGLTEEYRRLLDECKDGEVTQW